MMGAAAGGGIGGDPWSLLVWLTVSLFAASFAFLLLTTYTTIPITMIARAAITPIVPGESLNSLGPARVVSVIISRSSPELFKTIRFSSIFSFGYINFTSML